MITKCSTWNTVENCQELCLRDAQEPSISGCYGDRTPWCTPKSSLMFHVEHMRQIILPSLGKFLNNVTLGIPTAIA